MQRYKMFSGAAVTVVLDNTDVHQSAVQHFSSGLKYIQSYEWSSTQIYFVLTVLCHIELWLLLTMHP